MIVRNDPDSLREVAVSRYEKGRFVSMKLGESNEIEDKQRVYALLLKPSISQDCVTLPQPHIWLDGEFAEVPSLPLLARVTGIESAAEDVGSKKPAAVWIIMPPPASETIALQKYLSQYGG